MVFERHIVWPDGHREIEGVTPKQLPAPASHALPSDVGSDVGQAADDTFPPITCLLADG
jgi:hypothetical protein